MTNKQIVTVSSISVASAGIKQLAPTVSRPTGPRDAQARPPCSWSVASAFKNLKMSSTSTVTGNPPTDAGVGREKLGVRSNVNQEGPEEGSEEIN